ncbi:MAG: Mini-ribonuclease 3 [Firmicutes bacterium]|nr:Mini-ribonuclease 3 [Bacillota bacterium]
MDHFGLSPLTLAFVGDAVFTLFIRERLALLDLLPAQLTKKAAVLVSAVSQSELLAKLDGFLTEDERDIVRRCRNAHTRSRAKNAGVGEYRRATGLEGLIGHLYLSKDVRLGEVLDKCLEYMDLDYKG